MTQTIASHKGILNQRRINIIIRIYYIINIYLPSQRGRTVPWVQTPSRVSKQPWTWLSSETPSWWLLTPFSTRCPSEKCSRKKLHHTVLCMFMYYESYTEVEKFYLFHRFYYVDVTEGYYNNRKHQACQKQEYYIREGVESLLLPVYRTTIKCKVNISAKDQKLLGEILIHPFNYYYFNFPILPVLSNEKRCDD